MKPELLDVKTLADRYNLRVKRDDCGEFFVPCKRGQIYEHGSGCFGVIVIGRNASARVWGNVRRVLSAAGFALHQTGDSEGSLLFNGKNEAQCREAIRVMGAFRRRRYSPESLKKLTGRVSGLRNSAAKVSTKMPPQPPDSIAAPLVGPREGGGR